MKNKKNVDVVIIGGGFYGCMIALYMRKFFSHVVITEKEDQLMTKASYNNQARVHNGYHYPRNFITALRSHMNYERFIHDFPEAVDRSHTMLYAIVAGMSKVTNAQFVKLCKQIGSPLRPVPRTLRSLFNTQLLEDVFTVDEVVFDAAKIRSNIIKKLEQKNVSISYGTIAEHIEQQNNKTIAVTYTDGNTLTANHVFNCTYANINDVLKNSALPLLPLKYEFAEMPLVRMPGILKNIGITIMDGPFFSLMPFPDKQMHSFHHVRYTPHYSWNTSTHDMTLPKRTKSNFLYMYKDAQRYIPALKGLQKKESIFEVKTVLMQNENNDGRPILFRKDYGIKNFHVVMGGKIDNIYDIFNKMDSGRFM